MVLLYSGITFALRSWDAGDANGRLTADRRIGENFLRREVAETFPMRWKDPTTLRFAFEGEEEVLRFVSSRPAGVAQGESEDPRFHWTTTIARYEENPDPNHPIPSAYVLFRIDAKVDWHGSEGKDHSLALSTLRLGSRS